MYILGRRGSVRNVMYVLFARNYQLAVNSLGMLGQATVIRGY
jgi:hypothetical protein